MNKRQLFLILRIIISLSLLALLLWLAKDKLSKIRQMLSSINISVFILAFLLFISSLTLMAYRLKIVLSVQADTLGLCDLFSLTLIGYFFTNFMPTSVGGDLVKGYYLSKRNTQGLITSYASVFFDRIMGMSSIALIGIVALVIMRRVIEHKFIIWAIGLLLFACFMFCLAIFQKNRLRKVAQALGLARLSQALKFDSALRKTFAALGIYANHKEIIVKTLVLSMLAQFIAFSSVFVLAKSLSAYIPLGKIFLIMPVIAVLSMLPITINGLGLREWAFVLFFSANVGEAAALSLSLLYLALFLLTGLIGGIVYLFWRE